MAKVKKKIGRPGQPLVVHDLATGKATEYASFRDVEKATGIDRRRLHKAAVRGKQINGMEFVPIGAWRLRGERVALVMKFKPEEMAIVRALAKWLGITQREFMERAINHYGEYINAQKTEHEKQLKAIEHGP